MPLQPPDKGASRAVFIGTATYHESTRLPQLANVASGVRRLRHLLCERDEAVFDADLCPPALLDPGKGSDVVNVLRSAAESATDVLLVYYAGHAVPARVDGQDHLFLVLSGAEGADPTPDSLDFVRIRDVLRNARARVRVLILDCCYSGIAARGTLSGTTRSLTGRQLEQMMPEDGWHIITSSAAERPAADSDGRGFTAFTGKLVEGLERGVDPAPGGSEPDHLGVGTLYAYARGRLPEQAPQILRDGGPDIALGPNPRRLPPHHQRWAASVEAFLNVCKLPEHQLDASVAAARDLVLRLARCRAVDPAAAHDPWRSPGFAERMSEHLAEMVERGTSKRLRLSQAESLLVALMPFVYAVWWDAAIGESLAATDPEAGVLGEYGEAAGEASAYHDFLDRRPGLVRRARSALQRRNDAAARAISWWLYRNWVLERALIERTLDPLQVIAACLEEAEPHDLRHLLGLYGPLKEVLDAPLRALLTRPDPRLKPETLNRGRADKEIRTGLLARLLTVAQQMAIDPFTLPTAVDHISGGNAFTPRMLRECFWSWQPLKASETATVVYDLHARCELPEIAAILRAHCSALDHYILQATAADKDAEDIAVLRKIVPLRYGSLDVLPKKDAYGKPRFSLTEMRLTLDDDRIRELLMGTQIYHDPEVALRELFQNALDACRHRERRIAFLDYADSTRNLGAGWRGKITFTSGTEDGRAYIDCRDNGVGMGEEELEKLFARGGTRFTMSQEYLEEQVDWRRAGISMNPNSTFGIGVYSYFLLADEIRVVTRRFKRSGELGRGLQVDISGPGALFHIARTDQLLEAGTTVRLYLKQDLEVPPFTDVLRRWIWTSDYDLEAVGDSADDTFRLAAGTVGGTVGGTAGGVSAAGTDVVPTGDPPDLWWCSGEGGVLRDGIWINHPLFGAVVNLTGAAAPELTIDRNHPRNPDAIDIDAFLAERVDALVSAPNGVLTPEWLTELAGHRPDLANAIGRAAVERGFTPWQLDGRAADIATVGCFTPEITASADKKAPADGSVKKPAKAGKDPLLRRRAVHLLTRFANPVADWRVRTWAKAGLIPGIALAADQSPPVALPGDALILGIQELKGQPVGEDAFKDRMRARRALARPRPTAKKLLLAARRLGMTYEEARARLGVLGWDASEFPRIPGTAHENDLRMISEGLLNTPPWLDRTAEVPVLHVLRAATKTEMDPRQVVERLTELGYATPDSSHPALTITPRPDDLVLTSQGLTGGTPWLDPDAGVPVLHVLRAAVRTKATTRQVADRLAELGYTLRDPAHPALRTTPGTDDLPLLDDDGFDVGPSLDPEAEVPVGHVLAVAARTAVAPRDVADRLAELGYTLRDPAHPALRTTPGADDLTLLSRDLDAAGPWLDTAHDVPLGHILRAAAKTKSTPRQIADRLAELGCTLPANARSALRTEPGEWDLTLLSRDLDAAGPWLDTAHAVPLGHIMGAAAETKTTPRQVADRLAELGYTVPDRTHPALRAAPRKEDLTLLSQDLFDRNGDLSRGEVPVGRIFAAALATGSTPRDIVDRLAELGYAVRHNTHPALQATPSAEDLTLVSQDLDDTGPWLDTADDVPLGHILRAAAKTAMHPLDVRNRLAELGFRTPDSTHPALQVTTHREDLTLVSRNLSGVGPWLDPEAEVSVLHVLRAADELQQEPWQVAARLAKLGFTLPRGIVFPGRGGQGTADAAVRSAGASPAR